MSVANLQLPQNPMNQLLGDDPSWPTLRHKVITPDATIPIYVLGTTGPTGIVLGAHIDQNDIAITPNQKDNAILNLVDLVDFSASMASNIGYYYVRQVDLAPLDPSSAFYGPIDTFVNGFTYGSLQNPTLPPPIGFFGDGIATARLQYDPAVSTLLTITVVITRNTDFTVSAYRTVSFINVPFPVRLGN